MPESSISYRFTRRETLELLATKQAHSLRKACLELVDLLFEYLETCCGIDCNKVYEYINEVTIVPRRLEELPENFKTRCRSCVGLSLPASAIGWLSSFPASLLAIKQFEDETLDINLESFHKKLSVLKLLLANHTTDLKITGTRWPQSTTGIDTSRGRTSYITGDHSYLPDQTMTSIKFSFLAYFKKIQVRPEIDLSMFPCLSSLIIDSVPSDCIINLKSASRTLSRISIQRSYILDLNQLLCGSNYHNQLKNTDEHYESNSENATSPDVICSANMIVPCCFYMLSHLNLSYCGLGELSGLNKSRITQVLSSYDIMSDHSLSNEDLVPLSSMRQLVSLNLSHNEFIHLSTLSGLVMLPKLETLNLSQNRLLSMSNAHHIIGNIKSLYLSGNFINTAEGLDKLYSLERLELGHNRISNLFSVSGLAKLPMLNVLKLKGNPIERNDPRKFRLQMYSWFRDARLIGSLDYHLTFRHVISILPTLDGNALSLNELLYLKKISFVHSKVTRKRDKVQSDIQTDDDMNNLSCISIPMTRQPQTCRCAPRRVASIAGIHQCGDKQLYTGEFSNERQRKARDSIPNCFQSERVQLETKDCYSSLLMFDFSAEKVIKSVIPMVKLQKDVSSSCEKSDVKSEESSFDSHKNVEYTNKEACKIKRLQLMCTHDKGVDEEVLEVSNDASNERVTLRSLSKKICDDSNEDVIGSESSYDEFATSNHISYASDDPCHPISKKYNKVLSEASSDCKNDFPLGICMDAIPKSEIPLFNGTKETKTSIYSFADAERNAIYDGDDSYSDLTVKSCPELYFRNFVFPKNDVVCTYGGLNTFCPEEFLPRIQLYQSDRDLMLSLSNLKSSRDFFHERWVGEKMLALKIEEVLPCGLAATGRIAPNDVDLLGFHRETIGKMIDSRKLIICISDLAIYFIPWEESSQKKKFPSPISNEALFKHAQWPQAHSRHPSKFLMKITIGFGFQRLTLHFKLPSLRDEVFIQPESSILSAFNYSYVVFTCSKKRTIDLVQLLRDQVGDSLNIENDDRVFLDSIGAVMSPHHFSGAILHYQILDQTWLNADHKSFRRSLVLTDDEIFLFHERYAGDDASTNLSSDDSITTGDVRLQIIDSAKLTQISEIEAADEDPRFITIIIKTESRLRRSHRWRLICRDGENAEKLVDDVRKVTHLH